MVTKLENTKEFFAFLLKKADQLANDAAFSGAWGDNGASDIRDQVKIYEAALKGVVPAIWRQEYKEFSNQVDPEYVEYQRLRAKFKEAGDTDD